MANEIKIFELTVRGRATEYYVVEADSGEEAVALFRQGKVDSPIYTEVDDADVESWEEV